MKALIWLFFFVFSPVSFAGQKPLPFEQLFYKGQPYPFYGDASTQSQARLMEVLKGVRLAENMAALARQTVRLRSNLGVGFESCGSANAFYSSSTSRIVICLELFELVARQAKEDEFAIHLPREEFARLVNGTIWAIFLHELGHALIDIDRIAITGREEDVADQFAVYFAMQFLEPKGILVTFPMVWFFHTMATSANVSFSDTDVKLLMANEHSLDVQRTFNVACWVLGTGVKNSDQGAIFVNLPNERSARCTQEFLRLDEGVRTRFQKYFLPQRGG